MAMDCTTSLPTSAFYSTNLNSLIDGFARLGQRICRGLGAPMINIEIHQDQLNEFISMALELFTKYAGYTREYLIFDSDLYEVNKGIRLDVLFSISKDFNARIDHDARYIPEDITQLYTIGKMCIGNPEKPYVYQIGQTVPNREEQEFIKLLNSYDYLVKDYRKVIAVTDFEEGSSSGVNTLFTIEQSLAQQTYFSYAMGNYGFDLISWYTLKDWLETREKMLALRRDIMFDERTQYLRIIPQPKQGSSSRYYGVVSCYVERPIIDNLKEPWVLQYATALTKIAIANVRGKYSNVGLFGGGSINYNYLLEQGTREKEALEKQLMTGASPGFGDSEPPMFFVG
jgi:hypothetical protein